MTTPTTQREAEGHRLPAAPGGAQLLTAAALTIRVSLVALVLIGVAACNDRRGFGDDLRGAAADAEAPRADAETGDVLRDVADAAAEDVTTIDVAPEDTAPELDTLPQDVPNADLSEGDPPDADDVETEDVADIEEDVPDIAPESPCDESGTLRYFDGEFLDHPNLSQTGRFRGLASVDVDGDGVDELIGYGDRGESRTNRLYIVREGAVSLEPIEGLRDIAFPFAAGQLRDEASGSDIPVIALRTEGTLRVHRITDASPSVSLTVLGVPQALHQLMGQPDLSVSIAAGRLWIRGDEQLYMLRFVGGELVQTQCDDTLVGPFVNDASTGQVWSLSALRDGEQQFGSLEPDRCDEAPQLSPVFASEPGVWPAFAHHRDGRWVILVVMLDDVIAYDGAALDRWEHELPHSTTTVTSFPLSTTAELVPLLATARLPNAEADTVIGHHFVLDPFERRAAFTYGGAPVAASSGGLYVSAHGRALMRHDLDESGLAPPALLPPIPNWFAHWAEFDGEPGMVLGPNFRATSADPTLPFEVQVSEGPLAFPGSPIPPGTPPLRASGTVVDADGRFVRSEYGVWPILSGDRIGFDTPGLSTSTPLSFGELWASGVAEGVLESALGFLSAGAELGAVVERSTWPLPLDWVRVSEGVTRVGRQLIEGVTSVRVVRDAALVDDWYAIVLSGEGLLWYRLDLREGELRPVDIWPEVGLSELRTFERIGGAASGHIVVGNNRRVVVVEVRNGRATVLNDAEVPDGRSPAGTVGAFVSQVRTNSRRGETFVDGRGAVWTIDIGGAVTQVSGLPTALSASRGDLNGDGIVDFALTPPGDPGFSLLYFGQCVPD